MIVSDRRVRRVLRWREVYFAPEPDHRLHRGVDVVSYTQLRNQVDAAVPFITRIVDLRTDPTRRWSALPAASRNEIRRAERDLVVTRIAEPGNEEFEAAIERVSRFSAARKLLPPDRPQLRSMLRSGQLVLGTAQVDEEVLVDHIWFRDDTDNRLRLQYSAGQLGAHTPSHRAFTGRANRLLHHRTEEAATAIGVDRLDLGGIPTNPALAGIARFKQTLGGDLVTEWNLLVAASPVGRLALAARNARHHHSLPPNGPDHSRP